jgi:hypothetical protein
MPTVTLRYTEDANGNGSVIVRPDSVTVKKGDQITFVREGNPLGRIRVTFKDQQFFSKGVMFVGEGPVEVMAKVKAESRYDCELLDDQGNVKASSSSGGAVKLEQN